MNAEPQKVGPTALGKFVLILFVLACVAGAAWYFRDVLAPGGKSAKPGAINAPNLTPGGELNAWTDAVFINTIRTGVAPSGHALNPAEMPWKTFGSYSDEELKAIFLYLQSLPKLPTVTP